MNNNMDVGEFLNKLSKTNKLVIVEGRKDKKALEALGVKNICCLNKNPIYKTVEEIASSSSKVIILTDLDKEGKHLYGKLRTQLQFLGVEVDNYFREFLFTTKIRQIEGLTRLSPSHPRFAVSTGSPVFMDFENS